MIEFYYKLRLGVSSFNHYIDDVLDNYLNQCIEIGIENIHHVTKYGYESKCRCTVEFGNGVKYNFWNSNKYYAWLRDGEFSGNIRYKHECSRPTAKTIYKFKKAIDNFKPEIIIDKNPFNL